MSALSTKDADTAPREIFGDVLTRLWVILRRPVVPGRGDRQELAKAFVDLAAAAFGARVIVVAANAYLLKPLAFDPDVFVNWWVFGLMQVISGVMYAGILYGLLLIPLSKKDRRGHLEIFAHGMRAFAVMAVIGAGLFVLGLDHAQRSGSRFDLGSSRDWLLALGSLGVVVLVTIWVVILPISLYLGRYYGRPASICIASIAAILAPRVNPVVVPHYFAHVVEDDDAASTVISVQFKKELETGAYSKECLVAQILERSRRGERFTRNELLRTCKIGGPRH